VSTRLCLVATLAIVAPAQLCAQTGNGAPSGPHYNLNIIGVAHDKSPNMSGASGDVIFVSLGTATDAVTTKILLSQSATGVFQVLDKNGTDGEASFALPVPGTYTVWARALGTPGGQSKIATCATFIDPVTGIATLLCSTTNEVFVRGTGKSNFRNVTTALTTITLVAGSPAELACGTPTVSLFATCLQGFLWEYDNNGLRLLQIRFYPNPA
jgi:hypothetical protein